MTYMATCISPLGELTMAADGDRLVGLWIRKQKYFAATLQEPIKENPGLSIFVQTKNWLEAYFAGENPVISDLPLSPAGSDFRKAVWDILRAIPYGQCTTYGEIAKKMATQLKKKSMSSQAVGGAVGHNPVSIIIPCHRVVGSNGSLTGFASGLDNKIKLLELEGVDLSRYFVPRKGAAKIF